MLSHLGVKAGPRSLLTSTFSVVLLMSSTALGFAPEPRPWPTTPERFLLTTPDHASPIVPAVVEQMNLEVYSYRVDGSVAIVWGADAVAPSNLSEESAAELSLGMARSMAPALGVRADDLYVRHALMLEAWGNVTIGQTIEGIEVPSGFVQFTFREGQLAAIRNELVHHGLTSLEPTVDAEAAVKLATTEARAFAERSELVAGAALEVWTAGDRPEDARLAYAVRTRSEVPPSELTFHVDANDGTILAVDDEVRFADGEGRVRIVVDTINPELGQAPHTATFLDLEGVDTDSDGEAQVAGPVTASYVGPLVRIRDSSGTAVERFDVDLSGPFAVFDHTPQRFSQADPFVHLNIVTLFAAQLTPTLGWLGQRLTSNVNINDTCNAFWNGTSVNFFRSGGGCNNTGRIASIIYHEFGHGYHGNLTFNTVGSIGEGTGDFLAGTILSDPIVGRGFSTNGSGIRRMDQLRVYPEDYQGQVHNDGLIWATALWDLRAAMIEKHGEWAGRRIVDRDFALALTEGPGLSTSYPAILSADDDDNNPNNGTPNSCEINAIFDAHGLIDGGQINHQPVPTRAFVRIVHEAPGRIAPMGDSITIQATSENRSDCGSYDPNALVMHYAIGDAVAFESTPVSAGSATVPGVEAGDVVRYWFEIDADGSTFTSASEAFPHVALVDPADEEIWREDFEADFGDWTHGVVGSDLVDDWEIGTPTGRRFDPFETRDGGAVAGTDLGAGEAAGSTNGAAKAGRHTFLESGTITTEGMENVRLELWQHYTIDGALRIMVDGEVVYEYTGTNDDGSGGWRFLSIPLAETASDRSDGFTVRFEVDAGPNNTRGGWTIDAVRITGAEIPPPPPPPPPPEDPPPKDPTPPPTGGDPMQPVPPGTQQPGPSPDPQDPNNPDPTGRGSLVRGSVGGGCVCAEGGADPVFSLGLLLLAGALLGARRRR